MNKEEKRWVDAITKIGCIVCHRAGHPNTPADIHHLKNGGRRIGHLNSIPLCPLHHRSGLNTPEVTSLHPWKKEFGKRYGTEQELFDILRTIV